MRQVLLAPRLRSLANAGDTYFWYAPGRRSQPANCLTWFTGGTGWGMFEMLVKATMYNMPLATAVAYSFADYARLPTTNDVMLYWWVPDPTFLRLAPRRITFPEHDADEWAKGNRRTASRDVSIDKHVSQDLADLAPDVQEFIARLSMSLSSMNDMLLDQLNTEDSNFDVACRWLRANEPSWSAWVPEKGKCFSQFGIYSEQTQQFLMKRESAGSAISCRACPSGFFSSRLEDGQGTTFICQPCQSGSFQASGASVVCDPCPAGSYQNETASVSCNRCPVGQYQDQEGSNDCKMCPAGTSTGLLGSVSMSDCGCKAGSINIGDNGTFNCVPCSEGLDCPLASRIEDLKSGQSSSSEFVPRIRRGYHSTMEEPLEIFHCRPEASCSGGVPGTCANGLEGSACAVCPLGQTQGFSGQCVDCGATRFALVAAGIPIVFVLPILAYYLSNLDVLAKATPFKSGVMAISVGLAALQSLAVVGLTSATWTTSVESTSSGLQIMLLDLDTLGVTCISGRGPLARYLIGLAVFPAAVLWLFLFWATSSLISRHGRLGRLGRCLRPWTLPFTANTAGLGFQLGFGTMAAIALKPFMCFLHPSGAYTMTAYPNFICGKRQHFIMRVFGSGFFIVFVLGFAVMCAFAAWNMPKWSAGKQRARLQSFRFFLANFRFDAHWFVLVILFRGLGFALAVALGAGTPPVQTSLASLVLIVYGLLQALWLPWKVPMINMADMFVNASLVLLVTKSIQTDVDMEAHFAEVFSVCILGFMFASLAMALVLSILVLSLQCAGIDWSPVLTLGGGGSPTTISQALKQCAEDLLSISETELAGKIRSANVYDMQTVTKCIDLLAEILPNSSLALNRVSTSRINPKLVNQQFSHGSLGEAYEAPALVSQLIQLPQGETNEPLGQPENQAEGSEDPPPEDSELIVRVPL